MRVVFWSEYLPPYIGGVERNAQWLLPELHRRGIELLVVTSHHYLTLPDEEIWQGIRVHRFAFSTALEKGDLTTWFRQQQQLARLLDTFNPDLYHIFSIGPSMVACLQIFKQQLKQRARPLVVTLMNMEHAPELAYTPQGVIAKTLLAASWITTVSQAVLEQTIHYLPQVKDRIAPLYSGYPLPPVPPTELAFPPRLLLLGRLVIQKGGSQAIAVFAKLAQRYPDLQLIIGGDGPAREPMQVEARALADRVQFTGWIEPAHVYALYNQATIVLMPSWSEGLPIVAIETAFMARPIVAFNIPGMAEIVVDGKTGILVEPHDVEGMAQAVAYLLDHPAVATAMGQAARTRVQAEFGVDRFVEDHVRLYQQLCEMRKTQ